VIEYALSALRQVRELRQHYEDRDRLKAIIAIDRALAEAERNIEQKPSGGLPAPRPCSRMGAAGMALAEIRPVLGCI
jgi:hypothetical protein